MRQKAGGELIVDGAITAGKIAAGSITTNALAAGAVVASKIAAGAVTVDKLQAGQIVTREMIVDGAVSSRFFFSAWTTRTISAIGSTNSVAISSANVVVSFVARDDNMYPSNPVQVTATGELLSAGSGRILFVLQCYLAQVWSTRMTLSATYTAASREQNFITRALDGLGYGSNALPNGSYRLRAYLASGSAPVDLQSLIVTMEQLNK